jgi:hypothetical protein
VVDIVAGNGERSLDIRAGGVAGQQTPQQDAGLERVEESSGYQAMADKVAF